MCITEGLVNQVICCDTTCAKSLRKPPDPKTPQDHSLIPCTLRISRNKLILVLNPLCLVPSTLAQIFPDNPGLITRYIRLVKQKYYETIGETIYCPLEFCRSPNIPNDKESKVVVCTKCRYPFCKFCRASWHGAGTACKIQNGYPSPLPCLYCLYCPCVSRPGLLMIGSWRSFWRQVRKRRNVCKSCTESKF